MKIKAPEDVKELIKNKFMLKMGKAVKKDGTMPGFTIITKRNYSMSYIKDVLEGRDPDLSVLFDIKDGKLYRNQDPVWSIYKGKIVSSKGAKVCGVLVTNEGIKEIPQESTASTPTVTLAATAATAAAKATLALEPLVVPYHVKEYIKDRFRIKNREVVYVKGDKPFGAYATIDGMHYSRSYVQQVLEDKNPDISDLFELTPDGIYRSQDPIWGSFKGKPINSAKVCGISISKEGFQVLEVVAPAPDPEPVEPSAPDDYYKAIEVPEHIKRLIKYNFKLRNGKAYYKYKTTDSGGLLELKFTKLAGRNYSSSYVLAVLKGEKPNLESLFTVQDGYRYRNDDPIWGKYKNTKVSKESSVCGEIVPDKVSSPSIPRPDDFAWLANMEKRSTPGAKYDYAYSYKGGEPTLAHRIYGVIYSTGFIDRMKAGEIFTQETRPPVPAYLFKHVKVPGNSPVIMTSDDETFWPRDLRLNEIEEKEVYMINGFIYTGEEIIRKVSRAKSCIWDLNTFIDIAKEVYPDKAIVANIPLSDREETGEI